MGVNTLLSLLLMILIIKVFGNQSKGFQLGVNLKITNPLGDDQRYTGRCNVNHETKRNGDVWNGPNAKCNTYKCINGTTELIETGCELNGRCFPLHEGPHRKDRKNKCSVTKKNGNTIVSFIDWDNFFLIKKEHHYDYSCMACDGGDIPIVSDEGYQNRGICKCPCHPRRNLNKIGLCECDKVCPVGRVLNKKHCFCDCPKDREWANGKCECSYPCPLNHIRVKDTCNCTCGLSCPVGQVLDKENCFCNCPKGWRFKAWDKCECENTCPVDHIQNKETCECECPEDRMLVNNTCVCKPKDCKLGQYWTDQSCKCNCVPILHKEKCKCDKTCPGGQILDKDLCNCRCPKGRMLVNKICECKNSCPVGQILNKETCQCECPVGEMFVKKTNACEAKKEKMQEKCAAMIKENDCRSIYDAYNKCDFGGKNIYGQKAIECIGDFAYDDKDVDPWSCLEYKKSHKKRKYYECALQSKEDFMIIDAAILYASVFKKEE